MAVYNAAMDVCGKVPSGGRFFGCRRFCSWLVIEEANQEITSFFWVMFSFANKQKCLPF